MAAGSASSSLPAAQWTLQNKVPVTVAKSIRKSPKTVTPEPTGCSSQHRPVVVDGLPR